MKKIISLVLVALLVATVAYAVPVSSPGVGDILGQGKFADEPGKIFRLIRFVPAEGSKTPNIEDTLTADSIVVWDKVSDDGVTVTTTTTSYDSTVAGIVVIDILTPEYGTHGATARVDQGRRNWGWLQTYGLSEVTVQGDSAIVGDGAAMSTSSKAGQAAEFFGGATASTTQGLAGFFFDTESDGATDAECFLNID